MSIFATNDREKENYLKYAETAISQFNCIFGVHGDSNALEDAQTGSLAEYTRRTDTAEEKINKI